jgi:hypothetical protein
MPGWALVTTPRHAYAAMMTHVLVTPERAAFLRERLKKLLAERWAAKEGFAAMCEKIATEPRSSFGKSFVLSFDDVQTDVSLVERSSPRTVGTDSGSAPSSMPRGC